MNLKNSFCWLNISIWKTLIPKSIHRFVYFHGVHKQNYVNCVTLQIVMNMSQCGVVELVLYVDLRFKDGHLSPRAVGLFCSGAESEEGRRGCNRFLAVKSARQFLFHFADIKGILSSVHEPLFIRAADERVLLQWHCIVGHDVCITGLRLMSSQGKLEGLFSPHVATLQCDLALVHMLTAGSLVEGMICQPLFIKRRQHKPVR